MAIEIVDFPINSMVIFQFAMWNYQRVSSVFGKATSLVITASSAVPLQAQSQ